MTEENFRNYLFICGVPRSGTTALVKILNKHDDICIGVERFKFIALQKDKINQFNEKLFDKSRFFDVKIEDTNVVHNNTYRNLIKKYDSAKIVGDKVPRYYMKLRLIWSVFPTSKVIYISRNLESVANSWNVRAKNPKDTWPEENNYMRAVKEWNIANGIALDAVKQNPEKFIIIKYEDTFSDGFPLMEKLLEEIGLRAGDKFRASYDSIVSEPRQSGRKVIYDGQEHYLESNADVETYKAVLDHRLRA